MEREVEVKLMTVERIERDTIDRFRFRFDVEDGFVRAS
jgi:hypothetical protein